MGRAVEETVGEVRRGSYREMWRAELDFGEEEFDMGLLGELDRGQ